MKGLYQHLGFVIPWLQFVHHNLIIEYNKHILATTGRVQLYHKYLASITILTMLSASPSESRTKAAIGGNFGLTKKLQIVLRVLRSKPSHTNHRCISMLFHGRLRLYEAIRPSKTTSLSVNSLWSAWNCSAQTRALIVGMPLHQPTLTNVKPWKDSNRLNHRNTYL